MKNRDFFANNKGFTIVEVMVAIAVMALAIVSVFSMLSYSIGGNARGKVLTESSNLVSQHIETILSLPNNHVWLTDNDGDGTSQDIDPNNNGIDDDDEGAPVPAVDGDPDFGLDDTGADADWSIADNSNDYDIFWNVAVDEPVPNINTIRVIAIKRSGLVARRVSVDFYRMMLF